MTSLNLAIIEFDIKRKESGNDYVVASDLDNKTGRDGHKTELPVLTIFVSETLVSKLKIMRVSKRSLSHSQKSQGFVFHRTT